MTNENENTRGEPPTPTIVVSKTPSGKLPPPADSLHRAVHRISLSALAHNFSEVESAANQQRCDVICVTKADSYGHGAVATSLYLADSMGADAFAVATLEEAITLRKAFQETSAGREIRFNRLSSLFPANGTNDSMTTSTLPTMGIMTGNGRSRRPPNIRIIVLGPPVGYPRCFDDYFHHAIEVMISGPEVARALFEWANDPEERKRNIVERKAFEAKEMAMREKLPPSPRTLPSPVLNDGEQNVSDASTAANSTGSDGALHHAYHPPSATLGNVSGSDLAKELRNILRNQHLRAVTKQNVRHGGSTRETTVSSGVTTVSSGVDILSTERATEYSPAVPFAGIEEAARASRNVQRVVASEVFAENSDDEQAGGARLPLEGRTNSNGKPRAPTNRNKKALPSAGHQRRRLKYHIVVDSGMGRLGFKSDPLKKEEQGKRRDSVEVIKELVDLEVRLDCPIELFGMVTHMADANSTSTFTNDQIKKFKSLLNRVRAAGISVPTISTDNSAALLTTSLTHFDPKELLTQEFAETRGFVRVGGAIYGQRPSFPQLRAVSTLMASVRHVAVLRKGESVGYDRAYVADRSVRIATLTIGFADGYPRELGNKNGQVVIRGYIFPVVGNVCMDMMMVELGDAGDKFCPGADVVVGDTAILWGPGEDEEGEGLVPLKDIAKRLNTTQSALTCGLDKERVLRHYA